MSVQKEHLVSDLKSTSANAVSTFRWEILKREFAMRTRRGAPARKATPPARVADPNA